MKKIFFTTILTILAMACKAQTVPLDASYWEYPEGTYIKDTFNEMDKFVGTWQYTEGTNTLVIVLQKKTHIYNGEYYEDFLVGEYRYVSNGVEIVNTLPLLNSTININGDNNNIQGKMIIPNNMFPSCDDCVDSERRFQLGFYDPDRKYLSLSLIIRYLAPSAGLPIKMTATLVSNGGVIVPVNSPTEPHVPYGEYIMIKQ